MSEANQDGKLLGYVAWDGSTATSERVLLRATVANRRLVERNQFVRVRDAEGNREGFLARVVAGPFFHRSGNPTVAGVPAQVHALRVRIIPAPRTASSSP